MAESLGQALLKARQDRYGIGSDFQRAQARYESNQGILDMLGAVPRAGIGLLSRAIAPLDYLGGISRTLFMTAANEGLGGIFEPAKIDINKSGDTSDDYSTITNIRRAVLQNPFDPKQPIAGFGDVPGLKWEEGDRFGTKALKSVGAFTADVASDPITYFTAGIGPIAKAVGLKAVGKVTAKEAGEILVEQTSKRASATILKESDEVARRAMARFPDLSKSKAVGKYIAATPKDQLAREAAEELGARATAVYRGPGKRALKKWFDDVADETGVPELSSLWSKQIDEVRGGLRVTSPMGKTWKRLTPGGVSPIEAARSEMFAKFGGTRLGQATTLGAERSLQQAAKRAASDLVRSEVQGLSRVLNKAATIESGIITTRLGKQAGRAAATQISREAQELVSRYQEELLTAEAKNVGDGELLRSKVNKYIQEYDLHPTQRSFDEDGLINPESELDEIAFRYARRFIESDNGTYLAGKDKFGGLFSDKGYIEGPRRILTKEAEEFIRKDRGVIAGSKATGKFKGRENFYTVDPETGMRWQTIDEANSAMRNNLLKRGFSESQIPKKWFEDDAETIYVKSMDRMAQRIEKTSPIAALRSKGLLLESDRIGGIDPARVEERVKQTIGRMTQVAEGLAAKDPVAASRILADASELQKAAIEARSLTGVQQNEAFGEVLEQIVAQKGKELDRLVQTLGQNAPSVKVVRSAYERMKAELARNDERLAQLMSDTTRLGTIQSKGKLVEIQTEFMNLWADNELALALTNYVKVNQAMGPVAQQLEAVLKGWRRMATIGRGPAFVLRNLGTWWNAFLLGATQKDFREGFKYMLLREKSLREYMQTLGTTDPEDLIKTVDGERLTLLDQIFKKNMSESSFSGMNMWEAHKAMEKQGVYGGTLTDVAIAREPDSNKPQRMTGRSIIGRGRQSIFAETGRGAVQPIRPERWLSRDALLQLGSNARKALREGELRPGARMLDAAVNNPWFYGMSFLSENSEVFLRASTFATGIRRYGADETGGELAALLTKASQFDYQDMSDIERKYVRQVAPFYIWTKNNVPFQFRNLFSNPGKVNAALRGLETAQDAMAQDEESFYNKYLPSWVKEQMGFATRYSPGAAPLAVSLNLPLADLNRYVVVPESLPTSPGDIGSMLGTVVSGTRDDAVGSLNPFAKAAIEAITQTNTFTGQRFSDQPSGPLFSYLPGATWLDPESGERMTSAYWQSQVRNLVPIFGQAERLLPGSVGREGVSNQRLAGNLLGIATSALPISVSATLTESQLVGELRSRNVDLEARIKKEARKYGMTPTEIRDVYKARLDRNSIYGVKESRQDSLGAAMLQARNNRMRALAAALAPG